jgi:plasmid stabilization system protein ParE
MAYLVSISTRAQRDLAQIYTRINADDSDAALKWYRGFKQAILTLEEQP